MTEETKHVRGAGRVPEEGHGLLCSDCGFCPVAPTTEKRRRKEPEAPLAVGARGREEPGKTLKRKEEQALDSTGEQCTVEQSVLAPAPATPAWAGPPSSQGMKCSRDGAHASVWE